MRLAQIVSRSAISLLLTTTALVCAQEQREEPKQGQESRPEATKPEKQNDARPQRQEEARPDRQGNDRQNNNAERQNNNDRQNNEQRRAQDNNVRQERNQNENHSNQQEMRSGQQENHGARVSNRRSARIPDDRFHSQFGREHRFRVQRTTVQGDPGFAYGGYSFILVDGWPADWSYSDDCYVDYVDGEYFLFDPLHPGMQVALVVVE